jgi:hypothetical protein
MSISESLILDKKLWNNLITQNTFLAEFDFWEDRIE